MSLTTEYRPQVWSQVIGQDHVIKALRSSVLDNRLHNAYLFVGLMGTGKTTCARILAKALNCPNRTPEGEPCNACQSCISIINGNSLDVKEIDMATNRGIDNVKEIQEIVQYASAGGRWRVVIMDEAHQMTSQAASALLKILEEPPKNVLWILCTTELHKILPTIRSRCQVYTFKKVAEDLISSRLFGIIADLKGNDIQPDEEVIFIELCNEIAKDSEGSVRNAESKLANLVSFGELSIDAYKKMFGDSNKETFDKVVSLCSHGDKVGVIEFFDSISETITDNGKWASDFSLHLFQKVVTDTKNANVYFEYIKIMEEYLRYIYQNQPIVFLKSAFLRMASKVQPLAGAEVEHRVNKAVADVWDLARWLSCRSVTYCLGVRGSYHILVDNDGVLVTVAKSMEYVSPDDRDKPLILSEHILEILKFPQDVDKDKLLEQGLVTVE